MKDIDNFLRFGCEGRAGSSGILKWWKEDFARWQILEHVGSI